MPRWDCLRGTPPCHRKTYGPPHPAGRTSKSDTGRGIQPRILRHAKPVVSLSYPRHSLACRRRLPGAAGRSGHHHPLHSAHHPPDGLNLAPPEQSPVTRLDLAPRGCCSHHVPDRAVARMPSTAGPPAASERRKLAAPSAIALDRRVRRPIFSRRHQEGSSGPYRVRGADQTTVMRSNRQDPKSSPFLEVRESRSSSQRRSQHHRCPTRCRCCCRHRHRSPGC